MLFIIEMGMLIGGIYALITAKIPSILVGGKNHVVEGWPARILGILFISPLPLASLIGVVLAYLFGMDGTAISGVLEIVFVFGATIIGFIVVYAIGKKDTTEKTLEEVISDVANSAIFYSLFGLFGFGIGTIIFSPLALYRSNQIIKLIDEHHIGEQYKSRIKVARVLAVIALVFWGCNILLWAGVILGRGLS